MHPQTTTPIAHDPRANAEAELFGFTVAAAATGAVPVPAASAAIVAENAVLIARIGSTYGIEVSLGTVAASMGAVGSINLIGRNLFVEGARAMGWFAGPLGVAGVSMLGAFTAGMQTWVLGQLAIAICENGGQPLPPKQVSQVMNFARTEFRQDVWDKVKRNMPEDEDN